MLTFGRVSFELFCISYGNKIKTSINEIQLKKHYINCLPLRGFLSSFQPWLHSIVETPTLNCIWKSIERLIKKSSMKCNLKLKLLSSDTKMRKFELQVVTYTNVHGEKVKYKEWLQSFMRQNTHYVYLRYIQRVEH